MSNETFVLTNADMNAVVLKDAGYINRRGAKLYVEGNYRFAVEYYRLAAAMGGYECGFQSRILLSLRT